MGPRLGEGYSVVGRTYACYCYGFILSFCFTTTKLATFSASALRRFIEYQQKAVSLRKINSDRNIGHEED